MKAAEYQITGEDYHFFMEIMNERILEIQNYMVEEPAIIAKEIQKVETLRDKLEMVFVDLF